MFKIETQTIDELRLHLDLDDIVFGWRMGLLSAKSVIELATDAWSHGSTDETISLLALLLSDQQEQVTTILGPSGARDDVSLTSAAANTWLYIQLQYLHDHRNEFEDPLALLENIYCSFEHPFSIVGLIRWIPAPNGEPVGDDRIMQRWEDYLQQHRAVL